MFAIPIHLIWSPASSAPPAGPDTRSTSPTGYEYHPEVETHADPDNRSLNAPVLRDAFPRDIRDRTDHGMIRPGQGGPISTTGSQTDHIPGIPTARHRGTSAGSLMASRPEIHQHDLETALRSLGPPIRHITLTATGLGEITAVAFVTDISPLLADNVARQIDGLVACTRFRGWHRI